VAVAAIATHRTWRTWLAPSAADEAGPPPAPPLAEPQSAKLSPQARKNLGLVVKPVVLQSYWRTVQVPGVVIDRPGVSDRGVAAPAAGVVARVYAFPGDTVRPGDRLFTLRLLSEHLQNAQTELFKAAREIQLVQEQQDRLKKTAQIGAIADARLIELDNQLRRLNAAAQAYRQDLLARGLSPAHLESVAEGKFISEIDVVAPRPAAGDRELVSIPAASASESPADGDAAFYEVQDLKVELGQQLQAGQTLCLLANHQLLYIEGRSFRREAPLLEQAAQNGWPVRVEFAEGDGQHWPPLNQDFAIRHLANTVDPDSRTLAFYLPLANQSRAYAKDGKTFLVWRFRPGQRVRLHVPVEQLKDVIVLPAGAVAREGPEAYVFRQNGDLFDRRPVHVLHEDRLNVVLANDGSIAPGLYVAQNAAAALNRVLKAQNASGGLPPGFHVHPDGTVHGPH
jgi:multidrug efflux pump subunit AcrA (membrane-fusion protein)